MSGMPIYYERLRRPRKLTDRWDDIHVMQDGNECVCSVDCPCLPEFTYNDRETGRRVFTHKSFEQLHN